MMGFWQTIPWSEVIGWGLLALLAVWLTAGLKGTRTIQILVGLGVLIAILATAEWVGVLPGHWEPSQFWPEVLLVFVILFQTELRRALAQIGRNPFRRVNESEETRVVEEIVKTAVALANRRVGAIIVIEREHELLDVVEVGTVIDGRISKELLTGIFLPYSPLHDGAVILRGSRVAAAGCFLPLSPRSHDVEVYGTRHRAALGITEETDAVAIAVSEETGTISLIVGGDMQRDIDAAELRERLTTMLAVPAPSPARAWLSRARS